MIERNDSIPFEKAFILEEITKEQSSEHKLLLSWNPKEDNWPRAEFPLLLPVEGTHREQFLYLFSSAGLIPELRGAVGLKLGIRLVGEQPGLPGFQITNASLTVSGPISASISMTRPGELRYQWCYSRHPEFRKVCSQAPGDLGELCEILHYVPLSCNEKQQEANDPDDCQLQMTPAQQNACHRIDLCEELLSKLDEQFSTGPFLEWSSARFSLSAMEQTIAQYERELGQGDVSEVFHTFVEDSSGRRYLRKRLKGDAEYLLPLISDSSCSTILLGIAPRGTVR